MWSSNHFSTSSSFPRFSGSRFFKVQVFQSSGFSGSRFFRLQVFLSPGFSGSRFFTVRVQGLGPGFRSSLLFLFVLQFHACSSKFTTPLCFVSSLKQTTYLFSNITIKTAYITLTRQLKNVIRLYKLVTSPLNSYYFYTTFLFSLRKGQIKNKKHVVVEPVVVPVKNKREPQKLSEAIAIYIFGFAPLSSSTSYKIIVQKQFHTL